MKDIIDKLSKEKLVGYFFLAWGIVSLILVVNEIIYLTYEYPGVFYVSPGDSRLEMAVTIMMTAALLLANLAFGLIAVLLGRKILRW